MSQELESLIRKLNPTCRRALGQAAELCLAETHYTVELEHFLVKLLESADTDVHHVLQLSDIQPHALQNELKASMENLKRGNNRTPSMSTHIISVLREAWNFCSVKLGIVEIRSGAILKALLENTALRAMILNASPLFQEIPAKFLDGKAFEEALNQSDESEGDRVETNGGGKKRREKSQTPALDQYTQDLTAMAKTGKIDPVLGRDFEIRQVIDILTRRRQNNPILTGEAGVGKTAVVEGFALRIASGDVPPSLANIAIRVLDLGLLQAGAGLKGEFENRLKNVIQEVKASVKPIILFIDEAHTLIGAGGQAGQGDAANMLKPALARGELRTIAATTWAEYKKYFEKDHALVRRFQVVQVDEPDEISCVAMLRGVAQKMEEHHKVAILDEAISDAVHFSGRYITGRKLPDKAIGVLDTACARVSIGQNGTPSEVEELRRRIDRLSLEKERLLGEQESSDHHNKRIADIDAEVEETHQDLEVNEARWKEEGDLVAEIRKLQEEARKTGKISPELEQKKQELKEKQGENPMVPLCVDSSLIAQIIAGWTGIPVGKMLTDEVDTIIRLNKIMEERIIGQNAALQSISQQIRTSRANMGDPGKPIGVFLLAGPSGVGKTETALTLADLLYGGERNLITINMSEFQEAHTVSSLKGSPPGYVGYGQGGVLTEAVRKNPYSVVLLDEVEKAHPDVMELFYQVFDKGVMEDGEGISINFKNTVIMLTTNMGWEIIQKMCDEAEEYLPTVTQLNDALRPVLENRFKPAFLGRLVTIPYYPLSGHEIMKIVRLKLERVRQRFIQNHNADLAFDEELIQAVTYRCVDSNSGARTIEHMFQQHLLPRLSEELLHSISEERHFTHARVSLNKEGQFIFVFTEGDFAPPAEYAPEEELASAEEELAAATAEFAPDTEE